MGENNKTDVNRNKKSKGKKKRQKMEGVKHTKTGSKTKTFVPDLDRLLDTKSKEKFFKWKSKHTELLSKGKTHGHNKKSGYGFKNRKDKLENFKSLREKADPYPGDAPIAEERLHKYQRGKKMKKLQTETRTKDGTNKLKLAEKRVDYAISQAARSEMLLQEESGFLEADEGETTTDITQQDIVESVDILSGQKHFELFLKDFGPYNLNYTRNGRKLLLGGVKGHMAAIDWQTKKLMCEFNVMETVHDVKWLHQETMFAVAQRQWTYVYDNQGIEVHCLKMLDSTLKLEYLPYHFLLASASAKGFLTYIDTSVGKKVSGIHTNHGRLDVMCQNPHNAVLHLGHTTGTVTLWTPNIKKYAAKMLCHIEAVRAVTVDSTGTYMATSGLDKKLKIWDLRMYRQLQCYGLKHGAGSLAFSQQKMVAAGMGNIVQVFKDCCAQTVTSPYMQQKFPSPVRGVQFCPYEDVLGVTHNSGFASLLVPGCGEPNFDAMEVNPFQTKSQRRQAEVKMLLDKIPAEMITLDAKAVGQVEPKSYDEMMKEENKLEFLKNEKSEFQPRFRMRGRSKAGKLEQRKREVKETQWRHTAQKANKLKREKSKERTQGDKRIEKDFGVLNRFRKKDV